MLVRRHTRVGVLALAMTVAVAIASASCRDAEPTGAPAALHRSAYAHAHALPSAEVEAQIARLRALTAPFHRFDAAVEAGWGTRITECFSSAEGGMGYHYGNTALIDGAVDVLEPELLLYEPQRNGRMRLVAVEYIVPFDLWTEAEPPSLYGQTFHRNEAFGLWVLHVWHFRHNPAGTFADWNPTVSCALADS